MPFDFKKEYKEFYMPKNKPPLEGFWWHTGVQDRMLSAYNGVSPQESRQQDGVAGVDYANKDDFNWISECLHHEIYLSDPRKAAPEKWKTVIRHPIKEGN